MEHTILALGECLYNRSFCRYRMVGIPVQMSVSMCRCSIHCVMDSMVGVGGALSVQERNVSITNRTLNSEFDVGIHFIYAVE